MKLVEADRIAIDQLYLFKYLLSAFTFAHLVIIMGFNLTAEELRRGYDSFGQWREEGYPNLSDDAKRLILRMKILTSAKIARVDYIKMDIY